MDFADMVVVEVAGHRPFSVAGLTWALQPDARDQALPAVVEVWATQAFLQQGLVPHAPSEEAVAVAGMIDPAQAAAASRRVEALWQRFAAICIETRR